VPYSIEGISNVRARALVLDAGSGGPVGPPGTVEATWESSQADRWHQVYVNGLLGGVTARPEDRRLTVAAPVGRAGPAALCLVEVVAVDAEDRWTDFGAELSGFGPEAGGHVRLRWQAGLYLDPALETFAVFGDGRTGVIDYEAPLNEAPIPSMPGGLEPWGYGCGGYGRGGYGVAAALYEWTTDDLGPGSWRLAVAALDAAGNRLAQAAEVQVEVAPPPRPPPGFRVTGYAPEDGATLAWQPSPDV
jgi:hypothetical protein